MKKYYRDDDSNNVRMMYVENLFVYFDLDKYVDSVVDHEGTLSIYWIDSPSLEMKEKAKKVWELLNECYLEHYVRDYKQID